VLLEKVTKLGASAVIFTVDTAWKSKRTRDVRAKTTVQVCPLRLSLLLFPSSPSPPLCDPDYFSSIASSTSERSAWTRLTRRRQSRRLAIKPVDEDQPHPWESVRQSQDIKIRT